MDLERMLARCKANQWDIEDLDWTVTPREMTRDEEMAVVQYFTDMAGIEMLAGELFKVQCERSDDPILREIFSTFVVDEIRHAAIAARLADHYDVHRYRKYVENPSLTRFRPHFVHAIRHVSAEVANGYITGGELLLDVALLRSLNDYVHDSMSQQAMDLINKDESRHIAMDFYMVEFYASDEYQAWMKTQPAPTPRQRLDGAWAVGNLVRHAAPFFRDVFFGPLDRVDPSGKRAREAFKRLQLIGTREKVRERPFWKLVLAGRQLFNHPLSGKPVKAIASRVAGLPATYMQHLYSKDEMIRTRSESMDTLAREAVELKFQN